MASHKKVLTTGEVAKICNVAPRTVSKWFDSGQLRGYKIPGSKDRRIPLDQLIRFMRVHGIPLDGVEGGAKRVIVLDADAGFSSTLQAALTRDGGFEVATAASAFEAGAVLHALRPHALVVDVTLPDVSPGVFSRFIRSATDYQGTRLIGTAPALTEVKGQSLIQEGFDAYLGKPFETRALVRLIVEFDPSETAFPT